MYQQIENLIKSTTAKLQFPLPFAVGRSSAINLFSDEDVLLWMLKPSANFNAVNNLNRLTLNYSIELFFYKEDQISNTEEETNVIIDDCQETAVNFLIQLIDTFNDVQETFQTATLETGQLIPAYKQTAKGTYSGVITTFNLVLPDNFDFCLIEESC